MPKPTKKPAHPKKYKILPILIALLLAAPLLYLAYDTYAGYQDKQRFETVRTSVEELRGRLQAVATNGEQWTTSASCSQGSAKFQEAAKSCRLLVAAEIDVLNEADAKEIINKYEGLLGGADDLFAVEGAYINSPDNFPANLEAGYGGSGYREKRTSMVCGSLFAIDGSMGSGTSSGKTLSTSFVCNSGARELHYPRSDI